MFFHCKDIQCPTNLFSLNADYPVTYNDGNVYGVLDDLGRERILIYDSENGLDATFVVGYDNSRGMEIPKFAVFSLHGDADNSWQP